ncbi:MAG: hypothetical protein ABGX22_04145 [Pirellulaceae bacterium]|nr:hypothetical protein [Planctomycetaceae bacterium]
MKILVPTKRVFDTDQKIHASDDGSHLEIDPEPEYFIPGMSSGFLIYYLGTLIYPETKGVEEAR